MTREEESKEQLDRIELIINRILRVIVGMWVVAIILYLLNMFGIAHADDTGRMVLEIKQEVEARYDRMAFRSLADYDQLLEILSDRSRYVVVPEDQFSQTVRPDRVVVSLRHDVDMQPFNAVGLARLEASRGMQATYYILPSARYAGRFVPEGDGYRYERNESMAAVYLSLARLGHEIGSHNNLLGMQLAYGIDPVEFQAEEMEWFRSLGIWIRGTCQHGSAALAAEGRKNRDVFTNFQASGAGSLASFGFEYDESQHSALRKGDSGGWDDQEFADVLAWIAGLQAGARAIVNTHPVYWGR